MKSQGARLETKSTHLILMRVSCGAHRTLSIIREELNILIFFRVSIKKCQRENINYKIAVP
jgi:hypothetical protein